MPSPPDPFQVHLARAATLFKAGDVTQAGQIWQAILKRDPANRAAKAGLYQVKLALEPRPEAPDADRLLRDGCALFDLGQWAEALQKWERVLVLDPGHRLALAYANDARKELGLPALHPQAPGLPEARTPARAIPGDPGGIPAGDPDRLVYEGAQLYDMGMVDEAVVKWERALKLAPDNKDVPAYLQMASREREAEQRRVPAEPPIPPPAPPPAPAPVVLAAPPEAVAADPLGGRIAHAEHLLQQQHLEEALHAFQELLYLEPEDPRILQGYHHARALLGARDEPPAPVAQAAPHGARHLPAPVGPPAAVTALSATRRSGFNPPGARKGLALPQWFRTPRSQALVLGVLVCSVLGLALYGVHRREAALKEAVATAKRNALKPIARMVEIPSLAETVAAIRDEAAGDLADDPLLALFRAQEWQRRDPDDPAAAELVSQAREKLAHLASAGTLPDFDKAVQAGDLEGARRIILALLRRAPDDPELRARARKVALPLAVQYATKDRMPEAMEALRLVRAMFPQDPSWQAKLKLLESIQAMAKSDRTPWIQLLG